MLRSPIIRLQPKESGLEFGIFPVADHHPEFDRTSRQLYAELLDQAEMAERLGYGSYWVAEHHFHHYGIVPAPAVLLSAIAQRTQTLRVGTGVVVCPFHHPIEVAEQYAMLDMLSGERLNFGTGSGYLAHEYSGFNVDPQQKCERFDEARAALQQYTDTRLFPTSKGQKFEDLYDRRLLIIGDLAYCREHIAELRDWSMIRMLALSNFGGLVHDQVGKSMQLFADEVIPAFARRGVSVT